MPPESEDFFVPQGSDDHLEREPQSCPPLAKTESHLETQAEELESLEGTTASLATARPSRTGPLCTTDRLLNLKERKGKTWDRMADSQGKPG